MRRPIKLWLYIALGVSRILWTAFLLLFDRGGARTLPAAGPVKPTDPASP
ncbi:hypothetical protein ABC974_05900 [Sphingomonas oligophenolica]|uniref:Uncharacterized protein n=1 Tax=Sphingomonas oligophenolica TaxID=301154 RepID=A0ABU9Y010_9SPHN